MSGSHRQHRNNLNYKSKMQIKMDEKEQKIKELFDMVYNWGRVGVVVDFESNAFRKKLKEVISSTLIEQK